MCVREKEGEQVCVCVRGMEREREQVCVCLCVRGRERERPRVCKREGGREQVCV